MERMMELVRQHEGNAHAERLRAQANVVAAVAHRRDPLDLLDLRHNEARALSAWYALHSLRLEMEQAMKGGESA